MTDIQPLESYPPGTNGDGDGEGRTVERRPSSGTVIAAVIGAMALIFGSLALIRAVNAPSGAETAEDAVKNLLDAIAAEDVIGVLQSLDPSERDTIKGPIEDMAGELKRLGILADGFDLRSISGIGLDFTDVDLSSTTIAEGMVAVSIDGGTMNTAVIPADLPLGPFFDTFFEETGDDPRDDDPSEDSKPLTEVSDFDIVAVERDGGWFVSLWYSVAEAARQGAGLDPPSFGQGIEPDGADSAEAAVEELVAAGVALDLRKVFALLPPGEASALHDYAPLFLDDVEADIAEWRDEEHGVVEVRNLELSSDQGVDRARVAIEAFDLEVTYDESFFTATYGGDSFEIRFGDEDEEVGRVAYDGECLISDVAMFSDERTEERVCRGDEDFPPFPEDLSEFVPALTAVRIDARWFVSPTRTVLDSVVDLLGSLDPDDLESAAEGRLGYGLGGFLYWPFLMAGTSGSESFGSESFGEVGESIEITPEQEACYQAESQLTEEEWEAGVTPPECEGVHPDGRLLEPLDEIEPTDEGR